MEDHPPEDMRRVWILIPVGAILGGSAVFFYGMVLFQNGLAGLTMRDRAIWLVFVGTMTGGVIGLILIRLTALSVRRRTRLILLGLLGAVCGLIPGLVYGFALQEVCIGGGIDYDYCGWPFLGWVVRSPWLALGLSAAVGGILGTFGGVTAAWLTGRRRTSLTLGPGPRSETGLSGD